MNALLLMAVLLPAVGMLLISAIVALGKRPGYRRRGKDENYQGPERRGSGVNQDNANTLDVNKLESSLSTQGEENASGKQPVQSPN